MSASLSLPVLAEPERRTIRFRFAARKALAALQTMVEQHDGMDLHAALKGCYFADKEHLNRYGRPVFGATYRAMRYGPVPLEIYEMLKAEPLWLAELDVDDLPWKLRGHRLYRNPAWNQRAEQGALSESDREAVASGFARACS